MTTFHAIILGLIEGITEFLPISSTAHLLLVSFLLKLPPSDFLKTFEIGIQSGAILAAVYYYRRQLFPITPLYAKLLVAVTPSLLIGFLLHGFVKSTLLSTPWISIGALFLGGIILLFTVQKKSDTSPSIYQSLLIGLAQIVSLVPGVSRSGATLVAGLLTGLSIEAATNFAFLLGIPTLLAATALDITKSLHLFTPQNLYLFSIGLIVSASTAYITIAFFISHLKKHSLRFYGIYRIVISVLLTLLFLI
jgi:undecaprenyl-diphosphatase